MVPYSHIALSIALERCLRIWVREQRAQCHIFWYALKDIEMMELNKKLKDKRHKDK